MISITDQIGEKIELSTPPKRIVSLVPSQTELLSDLGLDEEVVGITKFCIHPATWHQQKVKVGGTKKINLQKIKDLRPDLIIANKEENEREEILSLKKHCPVYSSNIQTLTDSFTMISGIAALTNRTREATRLITTIRDRFDRYVPFAKQVRVVYLIWKDPYMAAGGDTFIHHILETAGMINVFSHFSRYPQITIGNIKEHSPDVILLSSEPYPFKEKHISDFRLCFPSVKIALADGEMFSWYGSRLQMVPEYLSHLGDILL